MVEWLRPNAKALVTERDGAYGLTPPTDTERLDWIEANHACFGHYKETGRWWSRAGRSFTTAREAIDAAMLRARASGNSDRE